MVQIDIVYRGELRCEAKHAPSGVVIATDAPVDNQGRGESFSPTDLVATALGTCMLTIMGIVARKHSIPLEGTSVTVTKEMTAQPFRRIGKLGVTIRVPGKIGVEDRQRLENAAHTCPVHRSLHSDVQQEIEFQWSE